MNKNLCSLIFLLVSTLSWSQTGPYDRTSDNANIAQKIVHILDNSTVGSVQTVIGSAHVLVLTVMNPMSGKPIPKLQGFNSKDEVSQIIINSSIPWFSGGAYSLGLFQVGKAFQKHEAGHSVASAALGPLYLPTVALSYLVESHSNSLMEDWADLEVKPAPFMNTADAQVGLGATMVEGIETPVIVYKFSIEQRQVMMNRKMSSDKIYQWINTQIVTPLVKHQSAANMPTMIEFDLLKKTLNIVANNIDVYLGADQELRTSIQTEQRYLHIESNPALEKIHIKALDWSAQYGIEYNLDDKLSLTPRVGAGLSADAFSATSNDYYHLNFQDKYVWTGSYNFKASLEIKVFDYVTIKGQYKKDWFLNGNKSTVYSVKLSNEFRNPLAKRGKIQYLNISGTYQLAKWETNMGNFNYSQYNATLGLKF